MSLFNLFGGGDSPSTSSSANTTTTNTKTVTPSAVASDDSLSISVASDGPVTIADPTTIEKAFKFASETLGLVERTASAQQKSADDALSKSIGQIGNVQAGGADRLLYFGGAALAAVLGLAWVLKR